MLKTATRQKHFALNYATRLDAPLMLDGTTNTVADVTADRLGVDPIETMLHGELAALIVTAVCDDAMLSALESEAVLGYMQQKSYVQISEDVKRPLKSVDNALQRATRKIVASVRARVGPLLFDSMELPREEAPVAAR
jgi:RNA polymerase sporulation-specific sigma factor